MKMKKWQKILLGIFIFGVVVALLNSGSEDIEQTEIEVDDVEQIEPEVPAELTEQEKRKDYIYFVNLALNDMRLVIGDVAETSNMASKGLRTDQQIIDSYKESAEWLEWWIDELKEYEVPEEYKGFNDDVIIILENYKEGILFAKEGVKTDDIDLILTGAEIFFYVNEEQLPSVMERHRLIQRDI
jgi:hypothetical protein